MKLTQFVVPCRRFRIEVQYGEAEGLSAAEQMLLRAVAAGANTLDSLQAFFGLPPRMQLDLCIEMLHAGFIQVERPTGLLHVSEVVSEAMGDPLQPHPEWARAFASPSPPAPNEIEVLQDCVSGSLFRRPPPQSWQPGGFRRAPVDPELPEPDAVAKTDLMLVAASGGKDSRKTSVNDPTDGWAALRAHRIVNVTLKRIERAGVAAGGVVDLRGASVLVTARCFPPTFDAEGSMTEPPRFVIVEPREIGTSVRRRIAAGLTRLAEQGVGIGRNQFFRTLSYDDALVASDEDRQVLEPAAVVSDLATAVTDLAHGPPSPELHAQLVNVDIAARSVTEHFRRNQAEVQLISGAAEHFAASIRALKEAEQQVILGCPWMGRLGVDADLTEALSAAVSRGVQVHLLWGVSADNDPTSILTEAARQTIERVNSVGRGTGGTVLVPTRSCASHAKVITCDLDWMLVGSANYLNAPPSRSTGELGLLVARPDAVAVEGDGRPTACMPVADVVAWCRGLLRDFRLRRSVVDDPVLFSRRGAVGSVEVPREVEEASWGNPIYEKLWTTSWKKRLEQHQGVLAGVGFAPVPVFDGDHRNLLFEALARSKRRLVIASPRLGLGLLGSASLAALDAAVERQGLEVVVLHAGEQPGDPRERQRLADERPRLRELISKGLVMRRWDSHAKVLLFDDEVAIGSFNYLSFEGYYGNRNRARHELSMRVWSPTLADRLWTEVHEDSVIDAP